MLRKVGMMIQWSACFALLAICLVASLGCERPATAVEVRTVSAPSCPCGDSCNCEQLKLELAKLKAELAAKNSQIDSLKLKAIAADNGVLVRGVLYRDTDGEQQYFDKAAGEWKARPQPMTATKTEPVYIPPPQRSNCPGGVCYPQNSGGGGLFGWRR